MYTNIYLRLCFQFFWFYIQMAYHMVILFFNFLRDYHTVFHSSYPIYPPTSSEWIVQLIHISVNTCYFFFVFLKIITILMGSEVVSHYSFDLHFLNDWWCWSSFTCLLAIRISSFEKYPFKPFFHFWIGLFSIFGVELRSSLMIYDF